MEWLVDVIDGLLQAVMAIAGGVTAALGTTGSLMLLVTAAIGLIWLTGRALRI